MFNNSSKMLFLFILMSSTIMSISSNSWLGAWMGLEINLLSFIPLMNDNKNFLNSSEASLKYFLIQAIASTILLFSIILMHLKTNFISQFNYKLFYYSSLISLSALFLKSGSAPFHFWFPGVMEGLSWINCLIIMTWQKIAPLMLISYLQFNFIYYFIISSIFIGSLGGLNQTSLRKIMAFSSITHIGWMLTAMFSSENLWFTYFLFYSLLSSIMIFMFNLFNIFHINQMFNLFFHNNSIKFILFINLLSLGGLPPFLGFIPKWFVIQFLIDNNQIFLLTSMVCLTLITLFFYIRLCFSAFILNYYENNWMIKNYIKLSHMISIMSLSFISISSLFLINLIYFIL
uniref:NADH-ubiquinone oxidoreductase chain 2 n=1 Tax=Vermiophis taishanensis TaxID=2885621 RepID=A0A8K1NT39_9DIPT|nr:NADH dehydrogenase subunit 2 [Vermiophis taishanensis]